MSDANTATSSNSQTQESNAGVTKSKILDVIAAEIAAGPKDASTFHGKSHFGKNIEKKK